MEDPSRRRVLAAGLAGAALGLAGSRTVAAGERPASVPPLGYNAADSELLGAAQEAELAARDLYQAAIDAGNDDDVYVGIRDNHRAYADVLSGLIGRTAQGLRNEELYTEQLGAFEGSSGADLAEAARSLEASLVATHSALLGELEGVDGVSAVASIAMVEARHTTVLADLAGDGDDLDALFDDSGEALDLAAESSG